MVARVGALCGLMAACVGPPAELAPGPGPLVSGSVVDENGVGIDGAMVSISDSCAATAGGGMFVLEDVSDGERILSVTVPVASGRPEQLYQRVAIVGDTALPPVRFASGGNLIPDGDFEDDDDLSDWEDPTEGEGGDAAVVDDTAAEGDKSLHLTATSEALLVRQAEIDLIAGQQYRFAGSLKVEGTTTSFGGVWVHLVPGTEVDFEVAPEAALPTCHFEPAYGEFLDIDWQEVETYFVAEQDGPVTLMLISWVEQAWLDDLSLRAVEPPESCAPEPEACGAPVIYEDVYVATPEEQAELAEHATVLGGVTLANDAVTDLSALACLEQAASLTINSTQITSLDDLPPLWLTGNPGLCDYPSLWLESNPLLTDITGAAQLEGDLHHLLLIYNTALADLDGLEGLTELHGSIVVMGSHTLTSLHGLDNIERSLALNITDNDSLVDLAGLEGLREIFGEEMGISGNAQLTDLRALDGLETFNGMMWITNNPMLPACEAERFRDRLIAKGNEIEWSFTGNTGVGPCAP
jgi:hypothetical protein